MRSAAIVAALFVAAASFAADVSPEPRPAGVTDDAARINAAWAKCQPGDRLVLAPEEYAIRAPVVLTSDTPHDVSADGATFRQTDDAITPILVYGGRTKCVYDAHAALPIIEGNGRTPGLRLHNLSRCRVTTRRIRATTDAVTFATTDAAGCNANRFDFGVISSTINPFTITTTGTGCWNHNTVANTYCHTDSTEANHILARENINFTKWVFRDCLFEGTAQHRLLNSRSAAAILLDHCWIEGPDYVRHPAGSVLTIQGSNHHTLQNTGGGAIHNDD